MGTKHIDDDTYFWAHIGVISFHVILGCLLIYAHYKPKLLNISTRMFQLWLGIILVIVSLLGLIPIIKYKDDTITVS